MNARITPEEQTLAVLTQAAGLGLVIDETLDGPTVYEVYWDMAEEPLFRHEDVAVTQYWVRGFMTGFGIDRVA